MSQPQVDIAETVGEGRTIAVQRGVLRSVAVSDLARSRGFPVFRATREPAKHLSSELTEERWFELIELLLKARKVLHGSGHRSSSTGCGMSEVKLGRRRSAGSSDRQPRSNRPIRDHLHQGVYKMISVLLSFGTCSKYNTRSGAGS